MLKVRQSRHSAFVQLLCPGLQLKVLFGFLSRHIKSLLLYIHTIFYLVFFLIMVFFSWCKCQKGLDIKVMAFSNLQRKNSFQNSANIFSSLVVLRLVMELSIIAELMGQKLSTRQVFAASNGKFCISVDKWMHCKLSQLTKPLTSWFCVQPCYRGK